jgi:hypothetical protein
MKTNSYFSPKVKKNFDKFFDKAVINRIAKASGFVKRKARKIFPFEFFVGFIMCCIKQKNTYAQWATEIGLLQNCSVSKQGIFDRITERAVNFARQLLEHVIIKQLENKKN